MLEYGIKATRVDAHGSVAHCEQAEIALDTNVQGRADAFNPAEQLLAAVAACILKNMERSTPMIHFNYRGMTVRIHSTHGDALPTMARSDCVISVDTEGSPALLDSIAYIRRTS